MIPETFDPDQTVERQCYQILRVCKRLSCWECDEGKKSRNKSFCLLLFRAKTLFTEIKGQEFWKLTLNVFD